MAVSFLGKQAEMEISRRWATKKSVINKAILYIYTFTYMIHIPLYFYTYIYRYIYTYIVYINNSTAKRGGKKSTSRTKPRLELRVLTKTICMCV